MSALEDLYERHVKGGKFSIYWPVSPPFEFGTFFRRLRDPLFEQLVVLNLCRNITMNSNVLPVRKPPVLSPNAAALLSVRFKLAAPTPATIVVTL